MMLGGSRLTFKNDASGKPVSFGATANNDTIDFILESEWQPTANELSTFAGEWYSEDADAKVRFIVEDSNPFVEFKNSPRAALRPLYKDSFTDGSGQLFWFDRDASGKVSGMHIGGSRMRDMPFARVK